MSINIQTEFNIGDKVWAPELYYDWCPIKNAYEVVCIQIIITSEGQKIFYTIKDCDGYTNKLSSKMCFSSYDKCKQWCDKENK